MSGQSATEQKWWTQRKERAIRAGKGYQNVGTRASNPLRLPWIFKKNMTISRRRKTRRNFSEALCNQRKTNIPVSAHNLSQFFFILGATLVCLTDWFEISWNYFICYRTFFPVGKISSCTCYCLSKFFKKLRMDFEQFPSLLKQYLRL